ncbi:MAG TPA: ABC transporter permease [Clostridia bacterium]|jgi:putative ABC transport system permease protein|nr:ABC transporter permease [Clostridia bacterium]
MVLNTLLTIIQQGFCYALVAMGVYISYKILDFPDLTVDGTFPLGSVVCVMLISNGVHFITALSIAFIAGGLAGAVTGILHVKFKISNLLAGILTMTALISINLNLGNVDGTLRVFISYGNMKTLFNNSFTNIFPSNLDSLANIIIFVIIVAVFKVLLDFFLKTKTGFMLKAVGNNEQMCTSLGVDVGNYKILGVSIANAMVALAGGVYGQWMNYYDNTSGTGMVVLALASVIIGCAIFAKQRKVAGTTAVIVGALIYTACLNIVIALGVPSSYLKLIMAILFAIILVLNRTVFKNAARKKEVKNAGTN